MKAMHPSTSALINVLSQVEPGEVITYDDLQAAINEPCRANSSGYSYLQTARNWLLSHKQMLFIPETGIGLRRCDKESLLNHVLESRRKSLNRRARKELQITTCVTDTEMTPAERVQIVAHQAIAGIIEYSTRKKSQEQLVEKAASNGKKQLGLQAAFDAFRGNGGGSGDAGKK